MDRKKFIKASTFMGGLSFLSTDNVFSQSLEEGGMGKLTDKAGNFALP